MTHCTTQPKPADKMTSRDFQARRAQVQAIKDAILADGKPELHDDSTALCSHFKLRRGLVAGETAEAQIYFHPAGQLIRFWVYGPDFSVKCRDLVILDTFDKGPETWLEADGKLFPHDGGKYWVAGLRVISAFASEKKSTR